LGADLGGFAPAKIIDAIPFLCYNALEKPLRFAFPKNLEFARKLEDGGNKGEELSLARGKCARKVLLESLPEIARVRLPPLRLCLIMVESPDKGVKWT